MHASGCCPRFADDERVAWSGARSWSGIEYSARSGRRRSESSTRTPPSRCKTVWCGTEMVEFGGGTNAVTQRSEKQGQYVGTAATSISATTLARKEEPRQ